MSVEQTLVALDERQLTARVAVEYADILPMGEISRAVTEQREDVIPMRPGRFVTAIETLPAGRDHRDPETFRFEFALPPDANVLLRMVRRARLYDPKAGILIDKGQFLDAVRAKYGAHPVLSRGPDKQGMELLSLEWVFPRRTGECSAEGEASPASERFQAPSESHRSSPSGIVSSQNCAFSVIMEVELLAGQRPIVAKTRTTFSNAEEIERNRRRHADHQRALKKRSLEQRQAQMVSAVLMSNRNEAPGDGAPRRGRRL